MGKMKTHGLLLSF